MAAIRELKTEFLMYVDEFPGLPGNPTAETDPQLIGPTPVGFKQVGRCYGGGTFEGPKLKGTIVEACDWFTVTNGNGIVDWRGTFRTDDGVNLYIEMGGFIHNVPGSEEAPDAAMNRFMACGNPETVCEYTEYYFRTTAKIWTGDPRYAWLNGLVCVAIGEFNAGHMCYSVYAVM